jgi:hypothetical protein
MVEVVSPYIIKEVIYQRNYPGYLYRREVIDDSGYGGNGKLEMVNCYAAENGHWIGDAKFARYLCKKKGLRQIQKIDDQDCVSSIGFNSDENKWYGWSHRAICGFGIGNKLFIEEYGDDDTLFIEHGPDTIITLEQAKQAAINFSRSVS